MEEFNKIINLFSKSYLSGDDGKFLDSVDFNKYCREIVNIKNPRIFDKIIKYMEGKYYLDGINSERKKIIKKILFNQKYDKLLDIFKKVDKDNYKNLGIFMDEEIEYIKRYPKEFDKSIKRISDIWLRDYITYYFFGENFRNFLINLNNMNRYMDRIDNLLIDKDHLSFYLECYKIGDRSLMDDIKFFKDNYQKENTIEMFYDDMRIVKNHSYQNLVTSSLDLNKRKSLYNEELSRDYKIPVYFLDGEKFHAFIRYINPDESLGNYDNYVNCNLDKDYYSFSYIGDNIGTIGLGGNGYFLLYSNINPNNITHVSHMDSSSFKAAKEKYFKIDRVNEIQTPRSLISDTEAYNEIVVKKDKGGIKPSALVCFDKIREDDVNFCIEYKLPIVLINTNKYYCSSRYTNYDDIDTYTL